MRSPSSLHLAQQACADPGEASLSRLLAPLQTFAPAGWLALRFADPPRERAIASFGAIEIRQTEPGVCAETCVKGEPGEARATALQRIGRYLRRNRRNGMKLRTMRPLVQTAGGPERWLVRIFLASDSMPPPSRKDRIAVRPTPPETLAVLRLSGRAGEAAIARGQGVIESALAATPWHASGPPMLRLAAPVPLLPFAAHFEIALPVAQSGHGMASPALRASR